MPQPNQPKVTVRPWQAEDIPAVVACQKVAYSDYPQGAHYDQRAYELQFVAFPEGQVLAELEGKVIGYSTSIIVQLDDDNHIYTYNEITGDGAFSTHDPSGDTLYGADIAVHPAYRGRGVSKRLYKARRRLMRRYNLRRMVAYGRLPGYNAVAGRMTAQEYVDAVVRGEMS
ncbi:MAG: GNAT family N-acetyltransferase, partial [Anaerolineae bacterium]|nr:GNAT family N-acetyltransferase [Anaerolineae bacterium]